LIERTNLEAVKFTANEGRRIFLVVTLAREASNNTSRWLREISVAVDFNLVRLTGSLGLDHA